MHYSELHLKQLSRNRVRELYADAERQRQLALLRQSWRARVARGLVVLAKRLEPSAVERPMASA